MELRILRYFLMTAQEGSITRAANQLHITQPTLSRQLIQLEEELGTKLFNRMSHSMELTEEGRRLVRQAQEIITLHDKTVDSFLHPAELEGEIGIGSGEFQSFALLCKWLVEFQTLHPRVRYYFFSGSSEYILEKLDAGILDIGLLTYPSVLEQYVRHTMPIQESWEVIMSKDHPLAKKEYITPGDLKDQKLALPARPEVMKKVHEWIGKVPYIGCASGNLPFNVSLYAKTANLLYFNLKLDGIAPGLISIPVFPPMYSSTILVWKKSNTLSPLTKTLTSFLEEKLKETVS